MAIIVYHYTTEINKQNILKNGFKLTSSEKHRLIPHSISFGNKGSWMSSSKITATLFPKKILYISLLNNINVDEKSFYDFGKKIDTPINRGKLIYRYAKKNNYDLIILKDVPSIGTEYAVLNKKIIKNIF